VREGVQDVEPQASPETVTDAGGRTLGPRLGIRRAAAIFGVAVAVRIAYVLLFLRNYHPQTDAQHYIDIATSVAHGHGFAAKYPYGFEHATAFRPPLYPLVLGIAFAVLGVHLAVAQALNVVIGSAVVVLIGLLATRVGGSRAGLIAAGLAAIYPPLLANDGVPLSEPIGLLVMLLAIWALLAGRPGWAGVAAGLLVLTRPSAQLFVPLIAFVLWRQAGFRRALAFAAIALAVVAPWVIRNETIFNRPVIVTSNGFNLAAIYSPVALAAGHFVDPVFDPRFGPVRDFGRSFTNLNEANLDSAFRREGLKGIREHPGQVPSVVWLNARRLVDQTWRLNDEPEAQDGRPLGLRHVSLPLVWLVEILGFAGLIAMTRQARRDYRARAGQDGRLGSGILPLTALYFFAVSVLTVSVPRLRAPVDVMMIIAVGVLIAQLWERRRVSADAQGAAHEAGGRGLQESGDVQPPGVVAIAVLALPVRRVGQIQLIARARTDYG
jgi:4-amino-4-deoxy-L-arabinose transferase-like glycosyltransferase